MSQIMGPTGLLSVQSFSLPRNVVSRTMDHLREHGSRGVEGVALWAGIAEGNRFTVQEAIIPAQKAFRSESGLMYVVEGDELFRVNKAVYEAGLVLGAQVHSHPAEAYHSALDDAHPLISVLGGLSVVVPDFGQGFITPHSWALYRLDRSGEWVDVSDVPDLITIA